MKMEGGFPQSLIDIMLQHPGLVINIDNNTEEVHISGAVKNKTTFQRLKLHCPHYPQMKDFKLHLLQDQDFKEYTSTNFSLSENCSLSEFLEQIQALESVNSSPTLNTKPATESNIYAEIVKLYNPDEYKIEINKQYTRIRFSNFAGDEYHFLELELPSLQLLDHSLPDCVPWVELFQKSAFTLSSLVALYQKYLEDLRPFYDCFIDIDELCHVVQPKLPTTKHNWRLFLLQDRVYLKLTIGDPFATSSSMSVQIIGPTSEVERLRCIYSEGMRSWDADLDIQKNLLRIFDLCFFPMPSDDNSEEQYCNICYSFRLDEGEVPIVSCDNAQCSLVFHATCLREWFNTLSDGKTFLDVAFGACPFCKAKLSTSFAALLGN